MAFKDNLISDLDSETAAYLVAALGITNALTRLQTARGVVDARNAFADYQGIMDAQRAAELLHVPLDRAAALGYGRLFAGHDTDCLAQGISGATTLKTYLQYQNYGAGVVAGAAWQYLVAPSTALLWAAAAGVSSIAKLTFAPAIADMGSRAVAGAFTPGADSGTDFVDGSIVTSKYAGAVVLNLTSATITGSGTVIVTGNGYGADGTLFSGHTWSVAVSGNTTAALVPSVTGDICYKVTGITIPAGITAGTLTTKCAAPRTNPPS